MKKKIDFEVVDYGMDSSDSFPGIGSGDFDDVVVGVGSNPREAFEDAGEQVFSHHGKDVDYSELEKETEGYAETPSVMYKVSYEFGYTSEEDENGKVSKVAKSDGDVHTDATLMSDGAFPGIKEIEDDGDQVWITVYDNSQESAAERVMELIDEGEYHVNSVPMKILKRISSGGEMNDMYYYVGIRYSVSEPVEVAYIIKKAGLFGKELPVKRVIYIKDPSENEIISKTEEALKAGIQTITVYSDDNGMSGKIKKALEDAYDDVEVAANNIGVVAVWASEP